LGSSCEISKIFFTKPLADIRFASRIRVALRFLDTKSFDRRILSV
jgi:hypothetical protein